MVNQADVDDELGVLFLANTGDPLTPNRLTQMVRYDVGQRGKTGGRPR